MLKTIAKLFQSQKKAEPVAASEAKAVDHSDPLDLLARGRARNGGWKADSTPITRSIKDFPLYQSDIAMDEKVKTSVMDDAGAGSLTSQSQGALPEQLTNWYMSQSFIGYQACAIIAQHWLIDKACSMAGEDAVRNGWEVSAFGEDQILSKADRDRLKKYDVKFDLKKNLAELNRFKNIFGIRVAIFEVESDDDKYYEKPFNIDGVTKGSYKGISQVDPYWMTPMLTSQGTSNPAGRHFYDPDYWVISGKKYHRSHLIIARGAQPADILKPTYLFGGIPLVQMLCERVYAAERTANEAPLLALNKRTTALHVDVEKAISNQDQFENKLMFWVKYRDNMAVKVLGKEEKIEQFDTSLADFDAVIMNQYQLVASVAKVPATKLLGTSPKGFDATGEFEMISYHEELESIQEHIMAPALDRHYLILLKSLGIECDVEVVFDPVNALSAEALAELNSKKATTDQLHVNVGAISPEEVRQRLRDDKYSGYNRLSDEEANEEMGMSPENIAALQKEGEVELGVESKSPIGQSEVVDPSLDEDVPDQSDGQSKWARRLSRLAERRTDPDRNADATQQMLSQLAAQMEAIQSKLLEMTAESNKDISYQLSPMTPNVDPIVKPSVVGVLGVTKSAPDIKLPKMKVSGILLSIENPRGTIRKGSDVDGGSWENKMPHHYGYIRGIDGADGDELDAFVGEDLTSDKVFVINQNDPVTGEFDEHKCMLGFNSADDAKNAYQSSYSDDWRGFGSIVELSMDDFKSWIKSDDCSTPLDANCIQNQTTSAPQMESQ